MTLAQLRYAVTLGKVRNFAEAAAELLIAQPTLSLQIQKLERGLQIVIFDRTTNPISVTKEGEEFLDQAKSVLLEADKLEYMFREEKDAIAGEIKIGIIPTISSFLLAKLLPVLRQNYPDMLVKIFEIPTEQIVERLENSELDLGILATPLHNRKLKEYVLDT